MGILRDEPNQTATGEFLVYATSPVTIDFYAFELMKSSGAGYGLQVFDDNGNVVFDALQKPFRVSGYIQTSGNGTYNYPAGKVYAMVASDLIGSVAAPDTVHTRFSRNSGDSIVVEQITHRSSPSWVGTTDGFYSSVGQIVVVDVTNL